MKTEMMETEKLLKEVNWFLKNKKLEVEKNEDTFIASESEPPGLNLKSRTSPFIP